MPTPGGDDPLARARALHRRGDLAGAEHAYRQCLATRPDDGEALHGLGLACLQGGAPGPAAEAFRRCLAAYPGHAPSLNHLGVALRRLNDPAGARRALEQALRADPGMALAHANLGDLLLDGGDRAGAVAAYRKAVALEPGMAAAHHNLGLALKALGRPAEAVAAYRAALAARPGLPAALANLGNALLDLGRPAEAEAALRQALAADPANPDTRVNLSSALLAQERWAEAADLCAAALAARPDHPQALHNLAALRMAQNRPDDAEAAARRLLTHAPTFPGAHALLGLALRDQGRLAEAVDALAAARGADPADLRAHEFLMHTARQLCDFDRVAEAEAALFARLRVGPGVSPLALMCAEPPPGADMGALLLENARAYVARTVRDTPALPAPPPRPDGPLTIGYLSADFGQHAVGSLVAELFARHDRSRFRVLGLPLIPSDGSPTAHAIQAALDGTVDLAPLSTAEAARAIRRAGVDILVDLMGHTRHARTAILAHRPAPIQVNYLGFPGTTGSAFHDYALVDPVVAPPGHERHFSEALCRLPFSYFPARSGEAPGRPPSRSACGLPERGFVFCCFNDTYKITAPVFALWMDLLKSVPGAVLWLRHAGPAAQGNLRAHARGAGVDPALLVFADKVPDHGHHLARQALAGLFLDTRPYNAHTTASDALWAGVPVLTCPGATFAGRVAASLLSAAGLPELIAPDPDAYRATALALATEPERLDALRERLKSASPLFDPDGFARAVEAAYGAMWARHRARRAPATLAITPEMLGRGPHSP
ncbi:MAG: tetratricopeptide repeat protein [Nitrospirae bacterium]|nr:tetratricopeptide repeat protein [Nitrospirota bacterium]